MKHFNRREYILKIQKIKINQYGKLNNKEIEFSDNINLIYGKNEAGKSTLLSYIVNTLYGISKTKKGKEYSNFEKYEPWSGEDFSGKLIYKLDDGETYEIQRDFKKKNPKIFNENKEDISKEFSIDKLLGNMFFYEQTKVDEELFLSTLVTNQKEIQLQKNEQNVLIQKIANLVGTGEDKVSYKIAMDRLNRRQLEEVGTSRSREKPINIIEKKLQEIIEEKEQLQAYKEKQYEAEKEENIIIGRIKALENQIKAYQEIKIIYEEQEKERQKIDVKENLKKQNLEKIKEIDVKIDNICEQKKEYEEKKPKDKKYFKHLIIAVIIVLILNCILQSIFWNKTVISVSILIASIFSLAIITGIITGKQRKNKQLVEDKWKQYEILQEKQNLLEDEIQILEKNNKKIEEEITLFNNQIKEQFIKKKEEILLRYPEIEKEKIDFITENNILYNIQNLQNDISEQKIKLHSLEVDKNSMLPKLEQLANLEEKYVNLKEEKADIQKLNTSIEIAKQILEECYEKMKHTITPKFTENLSEIVSKITNGKYSDVRFNDEQGLIVENEKGEYIPASKLSIGTIEQLYLSLRLSMIDDLSKEQLPIILDEAFAYFDDERLDNFLKYISNTYGDRQILILTCTDREKKSLDEQKIKYNLIELI